MKLWVRSYLGYPKWGWKCFEYRRDPVPDICNPRGYWRRFYRRFRTTQERRALVDPDHKAYSRAGRHCLPNAWDEETPREYCKSWKQCTRKRKQWERR
jgi:hypothetical protein